MYVCIFVVYINILDIDFVAELSAIEKYDPWGRGGCGAPIKDLCGNVVNDYTKRQVGLNPLLLNLFLFYTQSNNVA